MELSKKSKIRTSKIGNKFVKHYWREIKEDLEKWRYVHYAHGCNVDYDKVTVLPKLIHKLNRISVKTAVASM